MTTSPQRTGPGRMPPCPPRHARAEPRAAIRSIRHWAGQRHAAGAWWTRPEALAHRYPAWETITASALTAGEGIRRIIAMIRERWPNVAIVLRGDSGFARENLMRWCEGNAVDYVFGLARNDVLLRKAQRVRGKAAMAMIETNSRSAPTAISTTSPNPEPGPGHGASSPRSNTSPDTNSAAASSSPPWIATKSRPGNSTKTPIAHAATWKTASRTANSICSPIA